MGGTWPNLFAISKGWETQANDADFFLNYICKLTLGITTI